MWGLGEGECRVCNVVLSVCSILVVIFLRLIKLFFFYSVILLSFDSLFSVALPRGAVDWYIVCGTMWSYSRVYITYKLHRFRSTTNFSVKLQNFLTYNFSICFGCLKEYPQHRFCLRKKVFFLVHVRTFNQTAKTQYWC